VLKGMKWRFNWIKELDECNVGNGIWIAQSLPNVEWVLWGQFNKVEWDGDHVRGRETALDWMKTRLVKGLSVFGIVGEQTNHAPARW
jgi:hypothetical protein